MSTSSNVSAAAADVLRKPYQSAENGVYLWMIVGFSLGVVVFLILFITLLMYVSRRQAAKRKNAELLSPSYLPGQDIFCPTTMISSFSSSASDEGSEAGVGKGDQGKSSAGRQFRRPLGPSTSLDPPSLLRLTANECHVQPRPTLTRWHTVASPQTTPVAATLKDSRDSDEDEPHSPPCLHGRLWFSLRHDEDQRLLVTIVKAKHLPGRGLVSTPRDPFVKVFLLPDEENFRQTRIRKRTLAPKFNETFEFQVSSEDISKRTLKFSVYDVDKKKVRHCLGHVLLLLKDADLSMNGETVWRDLEMAPQSSASLGDLQICMSCNPYSNRIKATVCRARNLQALQPEDTVAYVKVDLYHGRKVIKSKRTAPQTTLPSTPETIFDESFSFGVSGRFFDSCSLAFAFVAGERVHGKVVVGPFMYARGEPLRHWQEMLANPRNSVMRWHAMEHPK